MIGTDGIGIEGVWPRVIPLSAIEDVIPDATGASIMLKNGRLVCLPTGRRDPMYPTALDEEQRARARSG